MPEWMFMTLSVSPGFIASLNHNILAFISMLLLMSKNPPVVPGDQTLIGYFYEVIYDIRQEPTV